MVEKPESSSRPVPQPGQTLFLCPLNGCRFYTDKEGMRNYTAAMHLSNIHNVRARDMVLSPGYYKYEKIKGEEIHNAIERLVI